MTYERTILDKQEELNRPIEDEKPKRTRWTMFPELIDYDKKNTEKSMHTQSTEEEERTEDTLDEKIPNQERPKKDKERPP